MNVGRAKNVASAVLPIIVCLISISSAHTKDVLTGKEIYRTSRDAVVFIQTDEGSGNGFIVSADGRIVTANHVVTTRQSEHRQYVGTIKVTLFRNGRAIQYPATPMRDSKVSDDQINFDYANLKIEATNLPHLELGNWQRIEIGDPIAIVTFLPDTGTMLLQGIVSNKGSFKVSIGPKLVDAIIFQCPVRNGVSGSPILNEEGKVIGVTSTKVFGIDVSLDALRKEFSAPGMPDIGMGNISLDKSFVNVINSLDQNLISGLGSGVSIQYAKAQQDSAK